MTAIATAAWGLCRRGYILERLADMREASRALAEHCETDLESFSPEEARAWGARYDVLKRRDDEATRLFAHLVADLIDKDEVVPREERRR